MTDNAATDTLSMAQAIRQLRTLYVERGDAPSFYDINNGMCDSFASDLIQALDKAHPGHHAFIVENANFMVEEDGPWDKELLRKHWQTTPPPGFTWRVLDKLHFGAHVWVTMDGKHFDAECPEGVISLFDLPLFRRYLISDGRARGLPLPDVITDDVLPAPMCPTPLPETTA